MTHLNILSNFHLFVYISPSTVEIDDLGIFSLQAPIYVVCLMGSDVEAANLET